MLRRNISSSFSWKTYYTTWHSISGNRCSYHSSQQNLGPIVIEWNVAALAFKRSIAAIQSSHTRWITGVIRAQRANNQPHALTRMWALNLEIIQLTDGAFADSTHLFASQVHYRYVKLLVKIINPSTDDGAPSFKCKSNLEEKGEIGDENIKPLSVLQNSLPCLLILTEGDYCHAFPLSTT